MTTRTIASLAAVLAATLACGNGALAQSYPSRPITMVVPFPPGGATDAIARILNDRLRQAFGQPVIIENIGGAGGSIGVQRVVRAAPDGYTLNLGQLGSHVMNGAALTLNYDLVKDLDPVSMVAANPQVIAARSGFPANNLQELIAWLKANPDKASVATVGAGSPSHVSAVYFGNIIGANLNLVPYRGGGPAMQDLVANQVDLMIIQVAEAIAQSQAGRLKTFAVTSKTRLPGAPDLPTVDEAGLPGMYISFWHGLWMPRGVPKDILARVNAAMVETLADPNVRTRLAAMHQEIPPRDQQTPEGLAAVQKAEIEKWWPIIKAAGIKAQ
ncbi:MAG: tripartite tricarboxylate transporter substrate binding protein BugD [Xanthobacteraceae bacterium]|nr:tripartite tricarboxylate transporter substrate binding protein BugD [Xanthobacteraceae bacterium]